MTQINQTMTTDHINIPEWATFIAQDADGQWWAYETEPNLSYISWYENEVGRITKLDKSAANKNWQNSLKKVLKP